MRVGDTGRRASRERRRHPTILTLATSTGPLGLSLLLQLPGVVNLNPSVPPTTPYPIYVNDPASMAMVGTALDDRGTGRGQAWVDVVGYDPSEPENLGLIGGPDGIHDLVQTNSDTPALPLGAGPTEWIVPPVAEDFHASAVYRARSDGRLDEVAGLMTPTITGGFDLQYPGGSPWGVVGGDYDDDGDVDLFYPCGAFNMESPNALMRNQGDGTFQNVTMSAGMTHVQASFGAAWFDYDLDGDLDLYVSNATSYWNQYLTDPFPDVTDRLYENEGAGTWSEVGAAAGIDTPSSTFSVGISDLDLNGHPDVVLGCYSRYNKVFYNNGDKTFDFMAPSTNTEFTIDPDTVLELHSTGKDYDFASVQPSWQSLPLRGLRTIPVELQDFNNDGWPDILFGSWSIQLPDDNPDGALDAMFLPAERAHLYLNRGDQDGDGIGDGLFRECAVEVGLDHVGGVMGMLASDTNGNGFIDVYMGGGGPVLADHFEEDYLYVNNGLAWPRNFQLDPDQPLEQVFYEVGALAGTYANTNMAHGVTSRRGPTGRMDIDIGNGGPAVFDAGQPNFYWVNTGNALGPEPNHLRVVLEPRTSAPGAYGARVSVIAEGVGVSRWQRSERRSGIGFASHDDAPLTFGLGTAGAYAVDVEWPSGIRQGRLLWPLTSTPEVTLVEPEFSMGMDVTYRENEMDLTLEIEETGPAPRLVMLILVILPQVGPPGIHVISDPFLVEPGVPITFEATAANVPNTLLCIQAYDPTLTAVGTANVWHEYLAAVPPGEEAQAPAANERTEHHSEVLDILELDAKRLLAAPARHPIEWAPVDLTLRDLVTPDGTRIARKGQHYTVDLGERAAWLQTDGDAVVVSLGPPMACCDRTATDTAATLLRFEGRTGSMRIDRRLEAVPAPAVSSGESSP